MQLVILGIRVIAPVTAHIQQMESFQVALWAISPSVSVWVLLMWTLLIISSRESELAVILPSNPLSLSPPVVYYVSCPSFPPSLSCDTASRCAVCSDCLSPAVPLQSICLYFRSLSILIDSYQDLLGCFRPLTHTQMLQSPNQSQRAWCLGELWLRVAPYMGVNQHQFAGWCVCGFVHDAHWCVCFCVCECVGRLIAEMVGDSHCMVCWWEKWSWI